MSPTQKSVAPDRTGDLAFALDHAVRLLDTAPALAADQAREILRIAPDHPRAHRILTAALRHTCDHYRSIGAAVAAERCTEELIRSAIYEPELLCAATAMNEGRLADAEGILKPYLKRLPTDFVAIRMLAEVAARLGRYEDSETLLGRCLELAPNFTAAKHNYAFVLQRQNKAVEALEVIDGLLKQEPGDLKSLALKASVRVQIGDYAEAINLYGAVLSRAPEQSKLWMSYGHALKTESQRAASIDAYRRAIALEPGLGEAYWSLANLKTFQFTSSEIAAMQAQLASSGLPDHDRLHFHFALGKALEDHTDYAASFGHYQEGNRLRRLQIPYDAQRTRQRVDEAIACFTKQFFADRPSSGCPEPDPIFIVGLPRSGSTLIEQILASHSAVEGTMELPDLHAMVKRLGGRRKHGDPSRYPANLADLDPASLVELGTEFLQRTRIQRKTQRPYFIDKMPNNFFHVGFIHLILPRARIIDARRHPMASGFSAFKQHFARGQAFSYDLADIGSYYADYVRLMEHFDQTLPGRIHRVFYERLVTNTENEVRRLLDYCGLPFEPACLTFWQSQRSVRTASAEQVRRPIFTDGLDQWRHYESWLGPLATALGAALPDYPGRR